MKAEYIDHLGDDLRVVNAARVSFDKESDWANPSAVFTGDEPILSAQDHRLILYLAKHGHWTPFAHPHVTMRETVPIFVARQRLKHFVGFEYNEVSRRYVDSDPEFFLPDYWRKRAEDKKQGSSDDIIDEDYLTTDVWRQGSCITIKADTFHEIALQLYKEMLAEGCCPEQARMILPQNMYTSYYVTGSLAAWARAYKQRIKPDAQYEIQLLAREWDKVIRPLFPASWSALVDG
jgi:thymidylate synthase (FAD)